jgi:DNA-binding CsgD family transcriptional regulator
MHASDLQLVERIYEAAVIPDLWPEVLERLAAVSQGQAGALVALRGPNLVGHRSSDLYRAGYDDYFANGQNILNVRPKIHIERGYPGFLADIEIQSRQELDADPIYTRFLRRHGLWWTAGTVVQSPGGDILVVDIARVPGKDPFSRESLRRIDPYRPHLARAALLASRFALRAASDMTDAMQLLGLPAIAISADGRAVAANALAESLGPRLSFRVFDRVGLASRSADALLEQALGAGHSDVVRSIPLPAEGDAPPIIVHLVPIRGSASDIFAAAKSLLLVTRVAPSGAQGAELLAGLFDLTPAESRIARALALGSSIEEIALEFSISVNTARNHLSSLFHKTGTRRQSQLVLLFSGTAPFQSLTGSPASVR